MSGNRRRYGMVAVPITILDSVDQLIEGLGYWPSRAAFTREACMEKLEKHRKELREKESRASGSAERTAEKSVS